MGPARRWTPEGRWCSPWVSRSAPTQLCTSRTGASSRARARSFESLPDGTGARPRMARVSRAILARCVGHSPDEHAATSTVVRKAMHEYLDIAQTPLTRTRADSGTRCSCAVSKPREKADVVEFAVVEEDMGV